MHTDLETVAELLSDTLTPTERLVKVVTGLSEQARSRLRALEQDLHQANGRPEPRIALLLLHEELVGEQVRPIDVYRRA